MKNKKAKKPGPLYRLPPVGGSTKRCKAPTINDRHSPWVTPLLDDETLLETLARVNAKVSPPGHIHCS